MFCINRGNSSIVSSCLSDGDDYESVNQLLTGLTNFSFQPVCVDINITNDMDIECEDIFNVSLTSSDPVVTIASGAAQSTVTIAMDAADGWSVIYGIFMIVYFD